MADCNETLRELETFLDGELSDDAQASIHDHLGSCMDCLQAFDFHAELRTVIREKCSNDELPPGLLDRIAACFGDEMASDLAGDHAGDHSGGGTADGPHRDPRGGNS